MSVQTFEPGAAFGLPDMQSYHSTWDDADYEPILPPRRPRWTDRLASIGRRLSTLTRRMAVREELYSMTDRELADMGINRYDVGRIFDPEFAREHGARGR